MDGLLTADRSYSAPVIASQAEFEAEIEPILRSDAPIIAGPWLSELGFEVLYWIPFLRWLCGTYKISPRRIVVLSRGGVFGWYKGVAHRYVELFGLMSAKMFRRSAKERSRRQDGSIKQMHVDDFDKQYIELAAQRLKLAEHVVLHPSLMYRLFTPAWGSGSSLPMLPKLHYRALAAPAHPVLAELPPRFYAARFYARPSLPKTPENARFVQRSLDMLAERLPVVVFAQDLAVDDHGIFEVARRPNLVVFDQDMELRSNLEVQSAVMARAEATVGTSGGIMYVPMMYGRSALGVYSARHHLLETHGPALFRMSEAVGAKIAVGHVDALDLLLPRLP